MGQFSKGVTMSGHVHKAIKAEFSEHFIDYLALVTGTAFFLMFLSFFQGQRFMSYITVVVFACFYCVWGVWHHMREDTLHLKNVLEYILISLCVLLLITALFIL